jgi:5-methylcytosine-specific restriction endonuclease McrA
LDVENFQHKCFMYNELIPNESLTINHIIPWSFLFSDDLWNLVYSHKSCNSSKYNRITTYKIIISLEERNKHLLN